MKSFRSGFYAFALAAMAVASTSMAHAVERVTTACTSVYHLACDFVSSGLKLAARTEGDGLGRPTVLQVQARAFVLRLAKRERPHVRSQWRMCPST
jgi:hypothetical protein